MQDINHKMLSEIQLEIKSILPYRDAFIIDTSQGKKLLRKSFYNTERIQFIHCAKEHLINNNFRNIDRYVCTLEGKPYIFHEGNVYTLTDHIEGIECNFDNRHDIGVAARLLAQFHKASKGFLPTEGSLIRDDLGRLPQYFSKRLDEIKKHRKVARRGKCRFDYLFLEYVDYFYSIGESTIDAITGRIYNELVDRTRKERSFCHHDYAHHNIISGDNGMYLLNFDFCCFELKTYDIANFLRRKMRKCYWDINEAKYIVDEYRTIEPIDEMDFYVLKLMLQFPQKLWRVVNKYYNSKRSWSEKSYIAKLQEVINEIEYHKVFMEKFDSLI